MTRLLDDKKKTTVVKDAPAPKAAPVIVLKLGGSIFTSQSHVARGASEIYRYTREGYRVIAVVSALAGITDALSQSTPHNTSKHAPYLLATGECAAAAYLALELEAIGIDSLIRLPHEISLIAEGPSHEATLTGLNIKKLQADLTETECIIVPGFFADNKEGRRVLLGRGGTDLTAAYLGAAISNSRIRLLKDVDGVYDTDPQTAHNPKRYRTVSYEDALICASPLIQPQTVEFSRDHKVAIEIAGLQRAYETSLCQETVLGRERQQHQPLKIAMLGCGVVGSALVNRLQLESEKFKISRILVRDTSKQRGEINDITFINTKDTLLDNDIDIFVDAGSANAPSADLIESALNAGIAVVSANKQALAAHLTRYQNSAATNGTLLLYSASVGGGAPFIEAAQHAKLSNSPVLLEGVLNGTCNFILELTANGTTFDEAVQRAIDEGYAEADPTSDLDGSDAAAKLVLLADAAFGQTISIDDIQYLQVY